MRSQQFNIIFGSHFFSCLTIKFWILSTFPHCLYYEILDSVYYVYYLSLF